MNRTASRPARRLDLWSLRDICDKRDAQGRKLFLLGVQLMYRSSEILSVRLELGASDRWLRCAGQVQPFPPRPRHASILSVRVRASGALSIPLLQQQEEEEERAGFAHGIRECLGDVGTHVSEMPSAISRTMKMHLVSLFLCRHTSQHRRSDWVTDTHGLL